jgi:hypothetical protein
MVDDKIVPNLRCFALGTLWVRINPQSSKNAPSATLPPKVNFTRFFYQRVASFSPGQSEAATRTKASLEFDILRARNFNFNPAFLAFDRDRFCQRQVDRVVDRYVVSVAADFPASKASAIAKTLSRPDNFLSANLAGVFHVTTSCCHYARCCKKDNRK